jgi:hypothetical protein
MFSPSLSCDTELGFNSQPILMNDPRVSYFRRWSRCGFFAIASLLLLSIPAGAQFPIWFGSGTVLEVEDIFAEGVSKQELRVTYFGDIDPASIDDNDVWAVSRNGYNELAKFERLKAIGVVGDGNIALADLEEEGLTINPFAPITVAVYSLVASNGQAWTEGDNGLYTVLLQPAEVGFKNGGFLPSQLLGMFRVAVAEKRPPIPRDWKVNMEQGDDGQFFADVAIEFDDDRTVVTDWSDVVRDGDRLVVRIEAKRLEAPIAADRSHRYSLADLEPGNYRFQLYLGDQKLHTSHFSVEGNPSEVPADVDIAVEQDANGVWFASVRVHLPDPDWRIVETSEAERTGNRFVVKANAVHFDPENPDGNVADPHEPGCFEKIYNLGRLEPGAFTFSFCINNNACPHVPFTVESRGVVATTLRTEPISAGAKSHQFHVIYQSSASSFDLSTFDNDDIRVVDPILHSVDLEGPAPLWWDQHGKLVSRTVSNDRRRVDALYQITGPPDGWQPGNLPLEVSLLKGAIATIDGGPVERRDIGRIPFDQSDPVNGVATIEIERTERAVLAHVKAELPRHKIVDWGEASVRGTSIFLDARAELSFELSPPTVVEHTYKLLDLTDPNLPFGIVVDAGKTFVVLFRINDKEFTRTSFDLPGSAGIFGNADIDIQQTATGATFANVNAFLVSHEITDWGVPRLSGNTFVMDARARQRIVATPFEGTHRYQLLPLGGGGNGNPHELDFEPVEVNLAALPDKPVNIVIRNSEQWFDFIRETYGPIRIAWPEPPVDFEKQMLVGVFAGVRPTGGYGVMIERITASYFGDEEGVDTLDVYYAERVPGPNEPVTDAETKPFALVATENTWTGHQNFHRRVIVGDGGDGTVPVKVDFEPVDLKLLNTPDQPLEIVIRSEDEFAQFIDEAYANIFAPSPEPPVDFEESALIGVFSGVKPTGGYDIRVESIRYTPAPKIPTDDGISFLDVHYVERIPGPDEIVTQATTRPYQFVAVDAGIVAESASIRFYRREVIGGGISDIPFEVLPQKLLTTPILRLDEPQEVVFRSQDDWIEFLRNFDVSGAPFQDLPVDFEKKIVVGVVFGQRPLGISLEIQKVSIFNSRLLMNYLTGIGGPPPPPDETEFVGQLVCIPKSGFDVQFEEEIIAFPSPPPPGGPGAEPAEGNVNADGGPISLPVYNVVFRVNGQVMAITRFRDVNPPEPRIPAEVKMEIVRQDDGSGTIADVHVEFPNQFPYFNIVDWGTPQLRGNQIILPSRAGRIDFILPPAEPIQQHHQYRLPVEDGTVPGEPVPFDRLDFEFGDLVKEKQNVVIQNVDDWINLWPLEIRIVALIPAPPVDLETHTIIAVFGGEQPTGCHGIGIKGVGLHDGVINVSYNHIVPGINVDCAGVVTFPSDLIAIKKTDLPIDFLLLPVEFIGIGPVPPNSRKSYEVLFQINGITYARDTFGDGHPIPPVNPVAEVNPEPVEGGADIFIRIPRYDSFLDFVEWGEATVQGRNIYANISGGSFDPSIPPEEGPKEFTHTYKVRNLQPGHHKFTLRWGNRTLGQAFFLVHGESPEPDAFVQWLDDLLKKYQEAETPENAGAPALSLLGDLDGDGMSDYDEFLLGMDPVKFDAEADIQAEWFTDERGEAHFAISFKRRNDVPEAEYRIEASRDLGTWDTSPELFEEVKVTDHGNGLEEVTICLKAPAFSGSASQYSFLRLRYGQQ